MKRIFILVLLLFVSLSFGSSKKDTNKSNDKKEQCYMSCRRKASSEDIRKIEQEYRSMH